MKTCVDREDGRGCSKILSQNYSSVQASELDVCEALEFGVPKDYYTTLFHGTDPGRKESVVKCQPSSVCLHSSTVEASFGYSQTADGSVS